MAQFRERLALDLADALTRDAEFTAHFFERARMAIFKAETQRDDLALIPKGLAEYPAEVKFL